MSNETNVLQFTGIKNLTRDDVIDHLERCQMAAEVTLPVERMQALLLQLLSYMDKAGPQGCLPDTAATPYAQFETRETTPALRDVAAERLRQITVEGWTLAHDDEHDNGEMVFAAIAYLMAVVNPNGASLWWPWNAQYWKPSPDLRRLLVKANALILAEIERLDRAGNAEGE